MKSGAEYINSREKRNFDLAIANSLRPFSATAIQVAKKSFIPEKYSAITDEPRAGVADAPIFVNKIRTTDPETGELFPHPLVIPYRCFGIDEIVQIRQIFGGTMSMIGRRALEPEEQVMFYESASQDAEGTALVDRYRSTVALARPGIVSSVAIKKHANEELTPDEILAMYIEEYETASITNDLRILARYLGKAVKLKLINGSLPTVGSSADTILG